MNATTSLVILVALGVTLAGCATTDESTPGTNATTSTPGTTTSTPVTTTTPTPGVPPECAKPAATNATPTQKAGYPEIVFTVKEPTPGDPCFAFVGPSSVAAGWTAVTFQNDGDELHIMPMYRVNATTTREDVLTALNSTQDPGWTPVGGVGVATPGSSGTSILDLDVGRYLLICFVDGHFVDGMFTFLDVTAPTGAEREAPTPNATITMRNFEFDVPNLTAGTHVIAFRNAGNQTHEAPLIRLTGNATIADFVAAATDPNATAPPPGIGVGGVNELAAGTTAYALVTLTPGRYGLLCFVEDPATGKAHVELGMTKEFDVT